MECATRQHLSGIIYGFLYCVPTMQGANTSPCGGLSMMELGAMYLSFLPNIHLLAFQSNFIGKMLKCSFFY